MAYEKTPMSDEIDPTPYKTADESLLREIIASAEVRLQSQLTASLAADQRALVLSGFLVPTIAALVGGAAALFLQKPSEDFLGLVALLSALGLFVSLSLTIYAARPVPWCFPGTQPSSWLGDIESRKSESVWLGELAEDADRKANENSDLMAANARCVRWALYIVAAVLLIAGIAMAVHFFGPL